MDSTEQRRPKQPLDILLVEDNEAFGESLCAALQQDGHRVLHLSNGLLARALLHSKLVDGLPLPDLIITAATPRGLDGLDIIASLRRAGRATKFVISTDGRSETLRTRARDLGALAVIDALDVTTLRALVASRGEVAA